MLFRLCYLCYVVYVIFVYQYTGGMRRQRQLLNTLQDLFSENEMVENSRRESEVVYQLPVDAPVVAAVIIVSNRCFCFCRFLLLLLLLL